MPTFARALAGASAEFIGTHSFVITDPCSQLLLLRIDANPVFSAAFETAQLS